MALGEQEIVRYSRQLLVPEIGVEGQERLSSAGARVRGGAALAAAAAYLQAGGTRVGYDGAPAAAARLGFWRGTASGPGDLPGALTECPAELGGATPWVAVGDDGERVVFVALRDGGCQACFRRAVEGLGALAASREPLAVGTLAALVFQRAILGQGTENVASWSLDERLELSPRAWARCPEHA